jgi:hypothetical protein
MILSGIHARAAELARFRTEAEAIACAARFQGAAGTRYRLTGFRIARTLPGPKNPGPFSGDLADYSEALRLGTK